MTAVLVEDYVRRLQQRGLTDSYHLLTDREKEVLQLLAEGRSNKEVAIAARPRPVDGRNASGEPDAEAEPAQHGRDRAVRRAEGADCLISHVDRMDGTAVSRSTEDMQTTARVTTQEQGVMAAVKAVPRPRHASSSSNATGTAGARQWRRCPHWRMSTGISPWAPRGRSFMPTLHARRSCPATCLTSAPMVRRTGFWCACSGSTRRRSVFEQLTRAADAVASR